MKSDSEMVRIVERGAWGCWEIADLSDTQRWAGCCAFQYAAGGGAYALVEA